jgi:hypothetical protein
LCLQPHLWSLHMLFCLAERRLAVASSPWLSIHEQLVNQLACLFWQWPCSGASYIKSFCIFYTLNALLPGSNR